jgi:multisubunit Na+/H+ antiporter MnhB subunit
VGFFQLPKDISNIIHCSSAVIFFCLLAYNSIFLFTRYEGTKTENKEKRNIVYVVCGIGMLSAMILMPIPFHFPAKTWWVETVSLSFFGISWLTKGGAFPFLND